MIDNNTKWIVYSDVDQRIRERAYDLYKTALKILVTTSLAGIVSCLTVLRFLDTQNTCITLLYISLISFAIATFLAPLACVPGLKCLQCHLDANNFGYEGNKETDRQAAFSPWRLHLDYWEIIFCR